jgi:putative N6-adenine-specific DNA methylase
VARRHHAFAVCTPGLEAVLQAELGAIGVRQPKTRRGGVEFSATTRQLYAANVGLRTATRVVVRASSFRARSFDELERDAASVPWDRWLTADRAVRFRVTSRSSRLYHTEAIADRLRRVTAPFAAGPAPASDAEHEQLVVGRVDHDVVTISIDSSGVPLYKRGWRVDTGKAPLRETLAAALLLATPYEGGSLLDPFCGSGTIAIEAALLARGLAPGRARTFAFEAWPSFEPGTWASVRAGIDGKGDAGPPAPTLGIMGTDRDAGVIDQAVANAERAGVADLVRFERRSVSEVEPPHEQPGWIITNPPYGGRASSGADLRNLFARFGQVVTERFGDWHVGVLTADPRLAGHTGLSFDTRLRTSNGGIPVSFQVAAPTTAPPDRTVAS